MPDLPLPIAPLLPGARLWGNSLQFYRNPAELFVEGYRRHGPIFRVRIVGEEYTVLAGEEALAFFLEHGERYFSRNRFFAPYARALGASQIPLGAPPSDQRALRRALRLGFSRQIAAPFLPEMAQAVQARASAIDPRRPVQAMEFASAILLDHYGLVLAGRPLGDHLGDARRFVDVSMGVGAKAAPLFALRWPFYLRSRRRLLALMQTLLDETRGGRRRTEPTVLDALLTARDPEGRPFADADLAGVALHGIVGTLVYAARAVSFLLYQLLRDADLLARAIAEADAAWPDAAPDVDALRRLPLLRAAYTEALRLHPIALGLPFDVEREFAFEGHRVAAGGRCLLTLVPSHFSERWFRHPYRFEVERCLPPRNEHKAPGASAPFGVGGRVCSAIGFVDTSVLVTVAALLRTGSFELQPKDYRLRTVPHPLPGPDRRLRLRRIGARTPVPASATAPSAYADALPPDEAQFRQIMSRLGKRSCEPGTVIVRQGETAEHFFILTEGEVEVLREDEGRAPAEVARLGPGQFFGEIGLLRGVPRTATVRALPAGATVLVMERLDFLSLVADADMVSDEIAQLVRRSFVIARLAEALPGVELGRMQGALDELRLRQYAPGEIVLRQGDPAESFFVVLHGELDVIGEHPDGGRTPIARLRGGQFFGEIGLLQRQPRTATVKAAESGPVEVVEIGRAAFERLVAGNPAALNDVVMTMCQRLVRTLESRR